MCIRDRDTTYHSIANNRIYGHELSAYLEDNIKMNARLRLNIGCLLYTSCIFHILGNLIQAIAYSRIKLFLTGFHHFLYITYLQVQQTKDCLLYTSRCV